MKKRTILVLISMLLMIVPYFINIYSLIRIISYLIGIVLFAIVMFKNNKNVFINIIVVITFLISSYFIDYYLSNSKHIPIFSKQVKSSDKVKSYYSLTYKLDVCENKYKVDKFYSNDYSCDESDLEGISVNEFISYYERNKKSYMKIEAKISSIVGESYFEISPYELKEEPKNGEVSFKDDIKIRVPINKSVFVNNYKIYDEITIIGRVGKITKEKNSKIYNLIDVVVYRSEIYDDYRITYDNDKKCEVDKTLLAKIDNNSFYTSCINNIIVTFNKTNIYDLDYVLLDKKITLEDLMKRSSKITELTNGKIYESDDLKFVLCNNSDVIFANSFDDNLPYCNTNQDIEDGV